MPITHINSIEISNRQRKEFKRQTLEELADSIEEKGLMHPVVLSQEPGNVLKLIAGERRLRAMKIIWARDKFFNFNGEPIKQQEVPYVLLSDLTQIQIREAELEENLLREDLTWQEKTDALNGLHALRKEQNPDQRVADTAREVESATGKPYTSAWREVRDAEIIGMMRDDEEVMNASSSNEAAKLATRKLRGTFERRLAQGAKKRSPHRIVAGDFQHYQHTGPKFDCIIADPPYGIGANDFGSAAKQRHKYDDSAETAFSFIKELLERSRSICKSKAHLYLFCDIDHFVKLKQLCAEFDWIPWRTPIVWDHGATGHAPRPTHGPRRDFEIILYANRGDRPVTSLKEDVARIPNLKDKIHAAQKPVDLYVDLLRRSCFPGDCVLDPCCGAGAIFPAANQLGLRATGVELDEEFAKHAETRLEEGK